MLSASCTRMKSALGLVSEILLTDPEAAASGIMMRRQIPDRFFGVMGLVLVNENAPAGPPTQDIFRKIVHTIAGGRWDFLFLPCRLCITFSPHSSPSAALSLLPLLMRSENHSV